MIAREMSKALVDFAGQYPAISITGPRQSGKTTLARTTFPSYAYVSFENPDIRAAFESDPRRFLSRYASHVIFDEAQRAPELFSYLQELADSSSEKGRFVLTGSQNFLLSKGIGQSLAGRVALFTLLPLSLAELQHAGKVPEDMPTWLYRGSYPRLFDGVNDPLGFYPDYVQTYLERDVRGELGVRNLSAFRTFLKLCAHRCGQLLNISSLASDCGIAVNTAKEWLSILEASYIVFLLRPYAANHEKRLIKTPKLYFYDSGLASYLMGAEGPDDLYDGGVVGQLFETAVISEIVKRLRSQKREPKLSFWRDGRKREIDLIIERGMRIERAVECKSSTTYNSRYFDALNKIAGEELGLGARSQAVVYGGDLALSSERGDVIPYTQIGELLS